MLELTLEQTKEIFNAQFEFNCFVVKDYKDISKWDMQKIFEWNEKQLTAYSVENTEMLDSINWKWWMKESEIDLQNAHVEIVDMLHFLVSVYQIRNAMNLEHSAEKFYNQALKIEVSDKNIYSLYLKNNKEAGVLGDNIFLDTQDLLNAFASLCAKFDLKGNVLYEKYFKKMSVNLERQRQKNGYSKETKNADDCKHI